MSNPIHTSLLIIGGGPGGYVAAIRAGQLGIPTVLVYGPDGQERFRLTGDNPNSQFTDRDIESAIETLLAQR